MFKFTSSAIENITEVQDGQVTITFSGGRDYTYKVAEPENFVSQLNEVIQQEQSVGRFVNSAIRGEQLVTLWSLSHQGLRFSWPHAILKSFKTFLLLMNKQLMTTLLDQAADGNGILQILDSLSDGMVDCESSETVSPTLDEIQF